MNVVDQLKADSTIVLRYWRTVEGWPPEDINEARSALAAAATAGGEELDRAVMFYAHKAEQVRPLLVDQSTVSVPIPRPFKPQPRPADAAEDRQASFF